MHTIKFENSSYIIGTGVLAGQKEKQGPLAKYIKNFVTDTVGQDTFEKAERALISEAIKIALKNCRLSPENINAIVSGDLLNQIISSSFSARDFAAAHVGLYSACATMAESLIIGAALINTGSFENVICATGSHFSSVERQYRFPLELGTQRTPTSQWTVTGAGATVLSCAGSGPKIKSGTFGHVIDYGVSDANNMGAAMAPAALNTIIQHLSDLSIDIDYYDMVYTGDLGFLGRDILKDLLNEKGVKVNKKNYDDCGAIIFSEPAERFQGGSGAGCSAVVLNSYIYQKLLKKTYSRILFVATGALLSPLTAFQGETIPCIAHAVCIEA